MFPGSGQRYVGDSLSTYGDNDLVLIPPNLPHSWSSHAQSVKNDAIVIQFSKNLIYEDGELSDLSQFINSMCGFSFAVNATLRKEIINLLELNGVSKYIAFIALLDSLRQLPRSELSSLAYSPSLNRESRETMDKLHQYLTVEAGAFKVASLAGKLGMSESTLRRFIKKNTGRTVIDYHNEMRLGRACEELLESNKSISEIALNCGFYNLSHFNRLFKKMKKVTPREYRRK